MLNRSGSRVASGSSAAEGGGGRGLFSKVKQGIAHTSITGAFGNKDLRELQNLISDEKSLLQSSSRMSGALATTSTSLAAWGASEGPDLADICQRASEMLTLVSTGFEVFSAREVEIRGLLKSVRTNEEELDELKKRRRAVGNRSESEEKKLVKMSSENKNLPAQTELLQSLRNEMRELDTEIMDSEARLSDHKRVSLKSALALKFGGLLELAEKATIIGELGKLLIEEVPLETTPPGYGRGPYHGHEKTGRLADEASRCVSEVHFTPPHVQLLPPSSSAVPPASQAPVLPPTGLEHDIPGSTYQTYDQFANSASPTDPSGLNGLHEDPTMLPLRFARTDSASPGPQDSASQVGVNPPPLSPAAAYRKSYQLGKGQPSPLADYAAGGPSASADSGAPRLDAYGNELPAGEYETEATEDLGAPLPSPGLRQPSDRPAPGAHRLTLGMGSDFGTGGFGSGGLIGDVPERTSSRGGTAPSPLATSTPAVPNIHVQSPVGVHESVQEEEEEEGETSLPYAADPSASVVPPPSSDGHSVLQPPSAPFAQKQIVSPTSEKESFVDASEVIPLSATTGQRDSVDLDYYSNTQYEEPPAQYQSPLPRPPQIVEPSAPTSYATPQAPALTPQASYSSSRHGSPAPIHSPVSVVTSPSPADPNVPRSDAELASAAARREVEREMDSLAISTASPISALAQDYAPRSGESGARKIHAGAFFKRNGAGGRSASFSPPVQDRGDDGVSEEDTTGTTRPLRTSSRRQEEEHDYSGEGFDIPSPPKEAAPPYH